MILHWMLTLLTELISALFSRRNFAILRSIRSIRKMQMVSTQRSFVHLLGVISHDAKVKSSIAIFISAIQIGAILNQHGDYFLVSKCWGNHGSCSPFLLRKVWLECGKEYANSMGTESVAKISQLCSINALDVFSKPYSADKCSAANGRANQQ